MRSGKPDPLAADIVHVREDRRNGADLVFAGRFGSPGGRVKMFDKNLVHALIGGKDLDCGSAELSVNLGLTRGHGSFTPSFYGTSRRSARYGRMVATCGRISTDYEPEHQEQRRPQTRSEAGPDYRREHD